MKKVKQIRESYDLITEKEEAEDRKLSTLVRAGLYDAKKLPALKKALEKSADKMTGQEKRMLLNLLDSLIDQVVGNDQVFRKVKQNVQHIGEAKEDYLSKFDPRFKVGYPTDKDIPSVVILKRKAIRVYPDNQKVALYYSQALDKYVTIPFSDIHTGINEEVKKDDDKKSPFKLKPQTGSSFKQEKAKRKAKKEKEDEFSSIGARSRALADRGVNVGGRAGTIINDLVRGKIKKAAAEKPKEPVASTAPEASKSKPEKTKPVAASVPKATKPAKPAKVKAVRKPVKATRPAKPAKVKAVRKPVKATRPAKPVKATRPAKPVKATRPAKSYAPANMDLPGLSESFKHKLQLIREGAAPRPITPNPTVNRIPPGPNSAQRYIRQPKIDKPANTGTKPSVLDTVKRYVNKYAPGVVGRAIGAGKVASPLGAFAMGLGTRSANPDESPNIVPTEQDKKKLGKPATAKELERNVKTNVKPSPSFEKTGRGTAPSAIDKPAQSPGLKPSPSFEKTGRGTASSIPNKPKKTEVSPNREAEPYTPVPKPAAAPAAAPQTRSVQQQPKPQTEPRDAAQPYKSNAEKAKDRSGSRSSGPKDRKPRNRRSDFNLALAAVAGGTAGAAVNHAFKLKADTGNAWEKQQRDMSPALRQRVNQANMRMMQQNESVVDKLKNMLDKDISEQTLSINEQEININNTAAKKIMYVYESVNATNKKKMEKMLNESAESFTKVLTFAIRQ